MLKIKNPGDPSAYYEERGPSNEEERRQMIDKTCDPDGGDTWYVNITPEVHPDRRIVDDETKEEYDYRFADGECYDDDGNKLPPEYGERVRAEGLAPEGDASSPESLRTLIANVEHNGHDGDVEVRWQTEEDETDAF